MGPFHPAMLALVAFFPFAFFIFKRKSPAVATAVVVLAGSLFLPEQIALPDLPLIPSLEKERTTYLAALFAILAYHRRRLFSARLGRGPELLFLPMMLGFVGSIAMNRQLIFDGASVRDALGLHWFTTRSLEDLITLFVPFVVGRVMFRSADDLRTLLHFVAGAGLIYTGLIVIELTMSVPFYVFQLSDVIYNVPMRPMWRWGIIQPVVFMDNGLSVASFMAVAVLCAAGLIAAEQKPVWRGIKRGRAIVLAGLLMSWNVAGIVYGYTLAAAMSLLKRRTFAFLVMLLGLFACAYPAVRLTGLFPDEAIVDLAREYVNEERAFSLEGRFEEEVFVIDTLGDRFWFGFGMFDRIPGASTFGRGGETGLDSFFVIRAGMTGMFGVEIVFLLLATPIFIAWRRCRKQADEKIVIMLAALMACVAIRMIDFLMNGLWNAFPFFLAGALYGVAASLVPQKSTQARQGSARIPAKSGTGTHVTSRTRAY